MLWAQEIEVFDLEYPEANSLDPHASPNQHVQAWNLAMLHPTLSRHRETLRVVNIRTFSTPTSTFPLPSRNPSPPRHQGLSGFDLRPFSSLTHLTLSRASTGTDPDLVHHLLAPRLRVFCWSLKTETENGRCGGGGGGDGAELSDLDWPEEDWLQALWRGAVSKNAALRRVEIEFTPAARNPTSMYPWDRLERLSGKMRPRGIALRWDRPSVSRKEFEKLRFVRMVADVLDVGRIRGRGGKDTLRGSVAVSSIDWCLSD